MASPQRPINDTLAFISNSLSSRYAAESMTEDALKNKPTDAEIRRLCQDTILKMKEFTSGHEVVFCTIPDVVQALTLAFNKLHQGSMTRLSVIMTGGIKIGRDFEEMAFQGNGRMRFFKNGYEEFAGTLLWEVEIVTIPDGRGSYCKELKYDKTNVWVLFKPGAGKEGAHLGDFYAKLFEDRLNVANKVTGKSQAKYFKHTPSRELTVWDTAGSPVNSMSMAIMHVLAVRMAKVKLSDDEDTIIKKMVRDEILVGYWIAEGWGEDKANCKSTFYSMGLLAWAIKNRKELANKIKG